MDVSEASFEMDVSADGDEMDVSRGAEATPGFEMDVSGEAADAPARGTGKLHEGAELRSATIGETIAPDGGAEYEAPRKTPKAAPIRRLPKALPV